MIPKLFRFCFICFFSFFRYFIQADDCYSCKNQEERKMEHEKWYKYVRETLSHLDKPPVVNPECQNASNSLPKIYCQSKCVKEFHYGPSHAIFITRYCLDRKSIEPYITANLGLGDTRTETCHKWDADGQICICEGHLCNESSFTTASTIVIICTLIIVRHFRF